MNWLNATFAGLRRLCSFAVPAFFRPCRLRSGAGSAIARPTPPKPKPSFPPPLALETVIHRRAMRQGNRKPEAVAAFVRTHTILSKGR